MKTGRWELRKLDDGTLRLLWWSDDKTESACFDLNLDQARELVDALEAAIESQP